jgi:3',5'-cyclic AMP phosphodiesterase CpdA
MLLCQLSDPHIVPRGRLAYGRIDTPALLERAVAKVLAQPRLPDATVVTGDLTDHASAEEYGTLREILAPIAAKMPLYLAVGNHDARDALRAAFPDHAHLAGPGGFVQYAVESHPVRLLVLDTLVPGAPGGRLCAERLAWLDRTLAESSRPTIVAQHHPPLVTGLTIMDEMALAEPEAEAAVLGRHPHVVRVICGHYHRNLFARFGGTVASVCPSAAHQLMLNLVPGADIRFAFEPSAFHLHYWNGAELVTHTEVVADFPSWGSRD